jgi:hypothetical protein
MIGSSALPFRERIKFDESYKKLALQQRELMYGYRRGDTSNPQEDLEGWSSSQSKLISVEHRLHALHRAVHEKKIDALKLKGNLHNENSVKLLAKIPEDRRPERPPKFTGLTEEQYTALKSKDSLEFIRSKQHRDSIY